MSEVQACTRLDLLTQTDQHMQHVSACNSSGPAHPVCLSTPTPTLCFAHDCCPLQLRASLAAATLRAATIRCGAVCAFLGGRGRGESACVCVCLFWGESACVFVCLGGTYGRIDVNMPCRQCHRHMTYVSALHPACCCLPPAAAAPCLLLLPAAACVLLCRCLRRRRPPAAGRLF